VAADVGEFASARFDKAKERAGEAYGDAKDLVTEDDEDKA